MVNVQKFGTPVTHIKGPKQTVQIRSDCSYDKCLPCLLFDIHTATHCESKNLNQFLVQEQKMFEFSSIFYIFNTFDHFINAKYFDKNYTIFTGFVFSLLSLHLQLLY